MGKGKGRTVERGRSFLQRFLVEEKEDDIVGYGIRVVFLFSYDAYLCRKLNSCWLSIIYSQETAI